MTNVYETPELLGQYLTFHYGTEAQLMPYAFGPKEALGFPVRCVHNLVAGDGQVRELAYDLGCAVGRSTFELAHYARNVHGFDLSARFIDAARTLLDRGRLETDIVVEGEITERIEVRRPTPIAGGRAGFEVGDAVELAETLPPADIVLAANMLCRLPDPRRFLRAMARLVKPAGQLLLVTPLSWLETFTPRTAWPRDRAGQPVPGVVWIEEILERDFTLDHSEDMPFMIREHARKYQWNVSHGMRWRRRD